MSVDYTQIPEFNTLANQVLAIDNTITFNLSSINYEYYYPYNSNTGQYEPVDGLTSDDTYLFQIIFDINKQVFWNYCDTADDLFLKGLDIEYGRNINEDEGCFFDYTQTSNTSIHFVINTVISKAAINTDRILNIIISLLQINLT